MVRTCAGSYVDRSHRWEENELFKNFNLCRAATGSKKTRPWSPAALAEGRWPLLCTSDTDTDTAAGCCCCWGQGAGALGGQGKENTYKPRGNAPPTFACVGEMA